MFLHPLMLAGAATVVSPVLIHLLSRSRYVDVTWAAMRFLRLADDRNRRRLRLADLLLLALRCGLLALLAVAAAGPVLGRLAPVGRGTVTAVIVIDCSASMTGTDGVASRSDHAKAAAGQLLSELPAGSAVAVLMASDTVAPLIPSPTRDLSLARKLIADAPITDRSTDLLPSIRAAADVLRPIQGAKEIDVITDGQRSGWAQLDAIASLLRAAPDIAARVVVVGPDVRGNVGIADLRPAGDLTPAGRPLRFEATITNYGVEPVTGLTVRLSIDAEPPSAEATVDHLPPGESRVVSLYDRLPTPVSHTVTASLPPDRMPADDRRTVVVRGLDRLRVLVVDGDTTEHSDRSAAAYLRAALLPVPADRRSDYFLQVTTVPPSVLATTRLADYAAVCCAGLPPADAAEPLAAYVRGGGGLIVFPDSALADPFTRLHLLPATLGPVHGDATHPLPLSAGPFDHPIATLWNDPANGSPAIAHVYRAAVLTPDPVTTGDAGPPGVILRFADGSPFAVERPFGRGRSILFAVAADTVASDLPDRGGLFVPLVYRCLAAVVNRGDEPLNVTVGQPLLGPAAVADAGRPVSIRTPTGVADTTVTLTGDAAGFRYDATDRAGPYAATVGGATTLFAAHLDPAESSLQGLTVADRAALSTVATISDGTTPAAVTARATTGGAAVALLLVALALAAAEPFIANRFSGSR
jgi:hypothetical protein